ncbi:MAG: aspartyl protease family protein [Verrucomicrobia bacterium]|nr:aspartyl protease family protein [Verrucomicrobiota bacterium]
MANLATVILLFTLCIGKPASLAGPGWRDQLERSGGERVQLRRTEAQHLFIFGKVNGRQRSVLVDTGWSLTSISTNAARALKTPQESDVNLQGTLFDPDDHSRVVLVERLELGRVSFTNQPALVRNVIMDGRPASFDLVLGCDFFIRNFAIIDCERRRLYTRRSAPSVKGQTELEAGLRHDGYTPVELRRTNPLGITCLVHVNGEPLEMLVDTAAVWSCLDAGLIERFNLKPQPTPRKLLGVGATGTRSFAVAKVELLEVGGCQWKNLNLALLDLRDWGLAKPDTSLADVVGILGGPELTASGAVIDFHAQKLWVKPVRRK